MSLLKTGLKLGEVLALSLANCPEFAVIVLGALEAGIKVSTVNHSYTAGMMYIVSVCVSEDLAGG